MKAVQFAKPGTSLETVELDVPEVPRGHVLIKVAANGICHSDSIGKDADLSSGIATRRIPGHEVRAGSTRSVRGHGVVPLDRRPAGRGVGWWRGLRQCASCRRGRPSHASI